MHKRDPWAERGIWENLRRFSKAKCRVLAQNEPIRGTNTRLSAEWMRAALGRRR